MPIAARMKALEGFLASVESVPDGAFCEVEIGELRFLMKCLSAFKAVGLEFHNEQCFDKDFCFEDKIERKLNSPSNPDW